MIKPVKIFREFLYPSGIKCIVCDAKLEKDTRYGVCPNCKLPYNENYCTVCGRAIPAQNIICDTCKNTVLPFESARSSFVYGDASATLVHKLKYRNARYLAPVMSEFMADTYFSTEWNVDAVTCVPIHKSRMRQRGYNQAELLAREVATRIKKDYSELLEKTVKTKNMIKLNRVQRMELIRGSFGAKLGAEICGKKILLIDDVLTTGATASECARVLTANGAESVNVLTFASVAATAWLA